MHWPQIVALVIQIGVVLLIAQDVGSKKVEKKIHTTLILHGMILTDFKNCEIVSIASDSEQCFFDGTRRAETVIEL